MRYSGLSIGDHILWVNGIFLYIYYNTGYDIVFVKHNVIWMSHCFYFRLFKQELLFSSHITAAPHDISTN